MDLNLGCEVMQIANVDELFMDLVGEDSNLSIIVYGQWGILCSLEFIFKYCNLHIISILVLIYDSFLLLKMSCLYHLPSYFCNIAGEN